MTLAHLTSLSALIPAKAGTQETGRSARDIPLGPLSSQTKCNTH
jgi:hypothetical protein